MDLIDRPLYKKSSPFDTLVFYISKDQFEFGAKI